MEYSITLDDSGVFNDDGIGGNEGDSQVMREKGNQTLQKNRVKLTQQETLL